jgi:hypothetical protein
MNSHRADGSIGGDYHVPLYILHFAVYRGKNNNILVCNWNHIGRFIFVPMFTRIRVVMVKRNENAADKIGYDRSLDDNRLYSNQIVLCRVGLK